MDLGFRDLGFRDLGFRVVVVYGLGVKWLAESSLDRTSNIRNLAASDSNTLFP